MVSRLRARPRAAQPRAALRRAGCARPTRCSTRRSRGAAARPTSSERTDVLSLLLRARDEDGRPMTDAELRDELFTMLGAGHETTATGLAFAFELLLRNPRVLERLREEIAAGEDDAYLDAVGQGDAAPAPGDRRRRAHAHQAAHGRRLGPAGRRQGVPGDRARAPARGPLPRARTSSGPSASSTRAPSPTRGCRSAAASAAASAPRWPRPRWPRCCAWRCRRSSCARARGAGPGRAARHHGRAQARGGGDGCAAKPRGRHALARARCSRRASGVSSRLPQVPQLPLSLPTPP